MWIFIQRKNAEKHDDQAVALEESKVPQQAPARGGGKVVEPAPVVVDKPKEKLPEVVVQPKVELPKVKTEVDLLLEKSFPIPSYKPLEELVQNWSDVPERAFPDEISVHVALDYQSQKGGGGQTMESGHLAKPVSFQQGEIEVVALDSPDLRAKVSMADTDFKQRVSALYEEKKEEKISKILAQRELNRTKAVEHLAKLKLKKEDEAKKEIKDQAQKNISKQGDFSAKRYGSKYRGDYWPVTKNGKNSEYDHEVPMGPIGGVVAVLYNEKEAEITGLWKKGPGERAGLKVGDVLMKVEGKKFSTYGRKNADGPSGVPEELGLAIIDAQAEERPLEVTVRRGGEELVIKIDLPALPPFGDEMPLDCVRSQSLITAAAEYLIEAQKDNGLWASNDYTSAWCGLSLLSTGNPKHAREVKKAARALAKKYDLGSSPSNKDLVNGTEDAGAESNWFVCMVGVFLGEYYLATGDKMVLDALDHCCRSMNIRVHPDNGRYGHGRDQHHLPYGGKGLVIINAHAHLMWALAAQVEGVENWNWDPWDLSYEAIEASFGSHGEVGYNFSARGGGQSTPRTGAMLTALALSERNKSDARKMGRWLGENNHLFPNVHAMTFIGPVFGFMGLKNTGKSSYRKAFDDYQWMFSLIQPANYDHGSYYYGDRGNSGGDEYCKKRLVGNVMALMVLNSYRDDTLWVFGNRTKNWSKK